MFNPMECDQKTCSGTKAIEKSKHPCNKNRIVHCKHPLCGCVAFNGVLYNTYEEIKEPVRAEQD